MRFSIVTPAYNAATYLPQMLDSLRAQSHTDWELRIVDDGSTDATFSIIAEAAEADRRIKPRYLPENSGSCYLPRAIAMREAEGEYIVNIDADDLVAPDYLATLERALLTTGADIAYADMVSLREGRDPEPLLSMEEKFYGECFPGAGIFPLTLDRWRVSGVGATARRLALASLEAFDAEFAERKPRGIFDNENLTRLDILMAESVTFCKANYFYREVSDSVSRHISPRRFELLDADMDLVEFCRRRFGVDSEAYRLSQRQLFHHVIEFMRFLNRYPTLPPASHDITRKAFEALDLRAVKGIVSPRYQLLMKVGYPVAIKLLRLRKAK